MEISQETQYKILELNKNAMGMLKYKNYTEPYNLLKEALKTLKLLPDTQDKFKLLGITYNNLGCFYKRLKKPKQALKFLKKACENEKSCQLDYANRAGTLLNMCAIYSELGKHKKALEQSLLALKLLTESNYTSSLISTLVIAYHNAGVEYEYLHQRKEALDYYKTGWTIALKYLGNDHSLTLSMHSNYIEASKAIQEREISHVIKYIEKKEILPASAEKKNEKKMKKKKKQLQDNVDFYQSLDFSQNKYKKNKKKTFIRKNLTPLDQIIPENSRYLTGNRLQPMINSAKASNIPISPITNRVHSPLIPSEIRPPSKLSARAVSTGPIPPQENSEVSNKVFIRKFIPQKSPLNNQTFLLTKISLSPNRTPKTKKQTEHQKEESKAQKDYQEQLKLNQEKQSQSPIETRRKTLEILEELEKLKTRAKIENLISSRVSISAVSMEKLIQQGDPKLNDIPLINPVIYAQSVFKGYFIRMQFQKIDSAVVYIQSFFRGYKCRKNYKSLKSAILLIQTCYRDYLSKKKL